MPAYRTFCHGARRLLGSRKEQLRGRPEDRTHLCLDLLPQTPQFIRFRTDELDSDVGRRDREHVVGAVGDRRAAKGLPSTDPWRFDALRRNPRWMPRSGSCRPARMQVIDDESMRVMPSGKRRC